MKESITLFEKGENTNQGIKSWLYFRIYLHDNTNFSALLTSSLVDKLFELKAQKLVENFWFMRKSDGGKHLRLRIYGLSEFLERDVRNTLIQEIVKLKKRNICREYYICIYEPEKALFGGIEGMRLAHHFFSSGSQLYLEIYKHIQQNNKINFDEISLCLINNFLYYAGLDDFEEWDVWNKVLLMRKVDNEDTSHLENKEENDGRLHSSLYIAMLIGPTVFNYFNNTLSTYKNIAKELEILNRKGELTRGIRSIVATKIIFQWNSFGFDALHQYSLAKKMVDLKKPEID